jgi:hypothetical protein
VKLLASLPSFGKGLVSRRRGTFTLLNGLEPSPMHTMRHVLHVIRQRLERYEDDLRTAKSARVSAAAARR